MGPSINLAEALVRSSVDGLFAVDRDLRYTLWNPSMEAFAGVTADDVRGRYVFDVFPFLRALGLDRTMDRVLAGETILTSDCPHSHSDGSLLHYDRHYSPLRDPETGEIIGVLGIVRDVTDRHRAEEALRKSEERLRASQKMEAMGRLAGSVAHDFNNLLTVILSCTDLIARATPADSGARAHLSEIARAAERSAALTRQLLMFSRKEPIRPSAFHLNALVADLETMLGRLIGKHIALSTRLGAIRPRVRADKGQIEQVLVNLVINARDALGDRGGRIAIGTDFVRLDDGARGIPRGDYVRLTVEDDGCGMSDEVKAHLFEPFFTTKPRGQGTGLGLATVYGIVTHSGGQIAVRSAEDEGTTMEVFLALADDADEIMSPVGIGSSATPSLSEMGGHERVLLVEDEARLRRLIRTVLVDAGYDVVEAANGDEALRAFDGSVDLVLSDVAMPGMSGHELAARVRSAWPKTQVLLMSGYDDAAPIAGDRVIAKPFTASTLARQVRAALDARR